MLQVLQLKLSQSSPGSGTILDDGNESDDEDEDEDEYVDDTESLKMRLSQIFDGKKLNSLSAILNGDDNNTQPLGLEDMEQTVDQTSCNHNPVNNTGDSQPKKHEIVESAHELNHFNDSVFMPVQNGQVDSDETVSILTHEHNQQGDIEKNDCENGSLGVKPPDRTEIHDVLVYKESRI